MKRLLTLGLAAVSLLAMATVSAQDWRREPTFGATYLQSGFVPDPAAYPLTAGGGSVSQTRAARRPQCCVRQALAVSWLASSCALRRWASLPSSSTSSRMLRAPASSPMSI